MSGTDQYWYEQGRYGGNRPDNNSSDKAWEKYSEGRTMREHDRFVEETLKRINDLTERKSHFW